MRISCPSCSSAYEVPESKLAPGRQVRCVKCNTLWAPVQSPEPRLKPVPAPDPEPHPDPEPAPPAAATVEAPLPDIAAPEVAPPPPTDPVVNPVDTEPPPPAPNTVNTQPPPKRPNRAVVGAAWLVSVALIAAIALAAVTYRGKIMQTWPPSARAYAWLGLGG